MSSHGGDGGPAGHGLRSPLVERATSQKWRRAASIVLAVVTALSLTGGLIGVWVNDAVFNADGMARRSVHALDSEAVRLELSRQLTDQLVKGGNREVIAFRPAAELTVELLIDSDPFKSLFSSAVRRLHGALLSGTANDGLDLSASLGLLASGLQLNQAKTAGLAAVAAGTTVTPESSTAASSGSMGAVVAKVADLPVWGWKTRLVETSVMLFTVVLLAGLGVVFTAVGRRSGVVRVGLAVMASGVLILLTVVVGSLICQNMVQAPLLRRAVQDAIWAASADLRAIALTVAVIGAVVAAAASPSDRFAPALARAELSGRYRAMRASTGGTLVVAAASAVSGLLVIFFRDTAVSVAIGAAGLALVFTATRLVVGLAAAVSAPTEGAAGRPWFGWAITVVGLLLIAVPFSVVTVRSAHAFVEDSYTRACLGEESSCDLRLDQVTLAGTHNSMSSPAYPGWLFAEQIESIGGQLNSGVRALLIDPHYGRKSSVKVPGSGVQLVLTDFAAELAVPGAEVPDQALRDRANALAASAPTTGKGIREVYLCHNYCELGAVKMVDEMIAVRRFLEANPSEIVMIIVQDAVSATDISAVFSAAGLLDHVATLTKGDDLPTLGDLVDADTRLVVFAERGEDDAPAWYPRAYDWFQETPYTWNSIESFTCDTNRGATDNPLFMINHWVGRSPPDPSLSKKVNGRSVLEARVQQCLDARGLKPTVLATDFATLGDVVAVAGELTTGD